MEDGSYTGQKFLSRVDERPGILPAIIRVGLPKIAFASLQDIGLPLPPYNEEVVWLQMSNGMADQYHDQADGSMIGKPYPPASLYNWASDEMKEGTANAKHSSGAISVWLTTALNRVNSMFHDEEVWFNRRIEGKGKYALRHPELVTTLDAIGDATISPERSLAGIPLPGGTRRRAQVHQRAGQSPFYANPIDIGGDVQAHFYGDLLQRFGIIFATGKHC